MSTTASPGTQPPQSGKVAFASMVGSAVEAYDFFIYGTAAAAYFGKVFFATDVPLIGILASFATMAVGFLMRPWAATWPGTMATAWAASPCCCGRCSPWAWRPS